MLLEKYPLPHNWTEVFDKGMYVYFTSLLQLSLIVIISRGRYYYWNMETNLVSWLPPNHPKAKIGECAAKIRMKLRSSNNDESDKLKKKSLKRDAYEKDKHDDRKRRNDEKNKYRRRLKPDHLDPMDPAAYSDIPKGTWSDGLENNKTDVTAPGALFQQRPYPAPGEVLAGNNKHKKRK